VVYALQGLRLPASYWKEHRIQANMTECEVLQRRATTHEYWNDNSKRSNTPYWRNHKEI